MSVEEIHWYGLSVTHARELKTKAMFDARGIETFLPMRYAERTYLGKTKRMLVPAFHNLLFIRTDEKTLCEIARSAETPFRCILDRTTRRPAIIPDKAMDDFKRVADSGMEERAFLPTETDVFHIGERVRVTQGPLKGIEGMYLRSGKSGKIAVEVVGMSVVTVTLPTHFVEKIESNQQQPNKR